MTRIATNAEIVWGHNIIFSKVAFEQTLNITYKSISYTIFCVTVAFSQQLLSQLCPVIINSKKIELRLMACKRYNFYLICCKNTTQIS